MKNRSTLVFLVLVTTLFSQQFFSQADKPNNFAKFKKVVPSDSLAGFDEQQAYQEAYAEGLFGEALRSYIEGQKRTYIAVKYDLIEKIDYSNGRDPIFNSPLARSIGGGGAINALPCVNEDFELNSLSNWTVTRGQNTNSTITPIYTITLPSPTGTQVAVVSTPTIDPFVGTIPVSPLGGSLVARINYSVLGGAQAVRIQQTFPVTSTNYLYEFAYWAVMENAGPPAFPHSCQQTPYMSVRVRNSAGTLQACPNFSIVAPATGGGCAGIGPTTWTLITTGGRTLQVNNSWQKFSIDLSSFIPNVSPFNNVTIDVTVAHCSPAGHFGYAYFDSNCNTMNLTVNGQSFNMPTNTVSAVGLCGNTATMVAPGGLGPYSWTGPPGTFTNATSQTVTTNVAGNYTLNMSPSGICNPPITRIITLSFAPPTTITASSNTVCSGSPVTFTASGATQYTWQPGNINTATYTANPLVTTVYSLTARTGTCIGNYTRQITVNPLPTIIASSPSGSVCGGNSTTLTATGGVTYTWLPMNTTGSTAVVAPLVNTSYTAVGTDTNGCIGSGSLNLGVSATPTMVAFNITNPSSSVCAGTPVQLVASGGAASVTWTPSGSNLFSPVLTPSVTTNYTLNGASGVCTGSTTITVSVDPGPSITVSSNPAISCPYIIGTLTAIAPSATGFTWTPPGTIYTGTSSTHTVNPATTTNYSVQGINSNGCRSTFTINQVVSPAPIPTIAASASSICLGTSVTYTATGGSSYTWNPGGTTGSLVTLSPTISTNYTIISSNGTCTNSTTQSITVVSNPTIGASASPTAICVGASAALTATGGTSYTWTPGPSSANPFNVSPIINTTYTVVGSVAGCTSNAVVSLVVNALPNLTVTATPTAICPGGISTISSSGAASYTVNPIGLTGANVTVSPVATTIYTVTGLSALGCTNTRTVQLTVNTPPTVGASASPASSVCIGGTVSLSGSGAATYSWIPNNQSGSPVTVTPAVSTNYTVIGTSAAGCTATATQSITVVSIPTIGASASPTAICVGASAALTATGGTSYTWTPGPSSANPFNVSPIINTTYTVVGSVAGCTSNAVVSLVVNALPNLTVTATPTAICPGGISNIASSGASSYTVNPGSTVGSNVTVSPVATTIYTVTGLSALGCTNTRTVQLTVNTPPTVGASASPASSVCLGGTVSLSGSGAATYSWIPNNQSGSPVTVTPAVSTNYTVIGTSAAGCTATATQSITVVSIPTIGASASPTAICVGASAALTATGGTSYTWTPGPSSANPFNVSPITNTTYTVVGSVAGCTSNAVVSVIVNTGPTITANATPTAICPGGITTLNGTGAASYTWNPGNIVASSTTVSPASTTNYTLTAATAFGCITTTVVPVTVNSVPVVGASASPASSVCLGGTVSLSGSGAATYSWIPNNQSGSPVTVTPAVSTNYTVIGTSAAGCTATATQSITVVSIPTIGASASPTAICVGASAALTATGGTSYTWTPGPSSANPFNVSPITNTTYTVVGSLAGCTSNAVVSVIVNTGPTITANATPTAICPGGITSLNGTGAASYTWNPGNIVASSTTVSPASTTNYTLTAATAFGCITTTVVPVTVNPAPVVGATTPSSSICSGATAILTGTGATTYTWAPMGTVATTVVVSPTVNTTYTVTGANAFGCSNQNVISITVNPLPSLSITSVPVSLCPGSSATLTASGATSYSWNTGATGAVTTVTNAGTYIVTGTLGACSASSTITILPLPGATLVATASPTAICPSGVSTCSVTGGVTYTWSTGSNANNISVSPTVTTTYSVIGTNGFGCTNTTAVTVIANPAPIIIPSPSSTSLCAGNSTSISASGASTYTWLPGGGTGATILVTPTITTIYTVTGTSSLSCTGQTFITITVAPVPTIIPAASTPSICDGASLTLSATGANSYTWLPGNLTGSLVTVSPTITTNYTVIGASAVGCTSNSFVTVTVVNVPTLTANASPTAICPGASSTMTVTGASSYTWMPGVLTGSSVLVSPLSTTVYTITGANSSGCTSIRSLTLTVNPVPSVSVSPINSTICAGSNVLLTGSGASVYSWTPGALISPTISANPTVTTTYTVTGANAFGCLGQATAIVSVQPLPVVNITPSATLICPGTSATLTASGGNFYSWNTGSTNTTIVVSPTTTTNYSLVGFVGSCSSTVAVVTVSLNVAPTLSVSGLTVANAATICAGNSLSVSASGAVNYTWNPLGLTGNSVVLSPTVFTIYTLVGSNAFGCVASNNFTVTVSPLPTLTASATSPTVCAGNTTSLIASGASSYTWNPGNIFGNAVTVTPTVNTIYTLSANSAFGCNSQTTVPVTVQALPVITATASPAAICIGGSATLTAVGASSFIWSNSVALATIIVNPTTTTVYSVAGGSGVCLSNTVVLTVIVNPLPTLSVAATSTALCPGGTATLTASGAASYTWNPGALNTNSIVVTPLATTIYTLNGTSAAGCSNSITSNMVVNPNPTVVITSTGIPICAGACATLAATGANNYTWMPGSLTGSSAVVCPTITTNYTVTGNSLGCTGLNTQNVTVNPIPVITITATPASICNNSSSTLTASGANTYTWLTSPFVNGSVAVVSPTFNTAYVLLGTSAAGCVGSQSVIVTVNSLPSISITSTSNTLCVGSTATLTGSGTLAYTWTPTGANTSTLSVTPSVTTVYTLTGSNGAGCTSSQFFTLVVVPIPTVVASASSPSVCEGFSVNLIGTGANTYTWLPGGATGSLIVVNPTTTTTYSLFGNVSGCSSTSQINILVNPLPSITVVSSPTAICGGATATLTANGAISYTWVPGLISATSIIVNPTSTTIYSVAGLNSFGCPNFTFLTLNVLATPTVIASSTSSAVCIGGSVTLSGNGAVSYTWNPGSITGSNVVVSPLVSTIYTLTGSNGACSTDNTISIVVNSLPIITTNVNSTVTCAGLANTFTAIGGNTYTWLPGGANGSTTIVNPTITTIYTVTGTDANGCENTANITMSVNPLPLLTVSASPSFTICNGATANLTANGALSYTWSPLGSNTNPISVTPAVNTTYTLSGTDANGCVGTETAVINVVPIPTIIATPVNPIICVGFDATITAIGANNYTWLPNNTNGSITIVNPTVTTTYTVIGDNGGNCPSNAVVTISVNPLPANVTALCSGTITCGNQTVSIIGASSNTNVSYNWAGPGSFTSSLASTSVNVWGNYTLSVTDNITGCTTTVVLNVPTDNSIPNVTASVSGSITCAVPIVTLQAANTTTNAGYLWTGPSTFSSILQSFTTNVAGVYTVVVTDLTSGCNSTKTVAVGSHTRVLITTTISPATCSLGISNNDGKIQVSNFGPLDKFTFTLGTTGVGNFTNAILIPTTGILTNNLSNPTNTVNYTVRLFDTFGCFKDTTLILVPIDCVPKVLGLAKAVTSSSLNADGTYNVNYKLTIKNTDSAPLNNVLITENLVNTFPAPTAFTVVNAPVITSSGSNLSINPSFDGITQTNITSSSLSVLGVGKSDTIVFTVKVKANGKFGPFNNRIVGTALTSLSVAIRDTSTNGLNPDPDGDLNPTNNSLVTPVSFSPNILFGLSKVGSFNKLDNNTYDVYYSITVHNLGNDTLRNIVVKDSLFGAVVKAPAKYTIRNGPATTSNLTPNALFDGRFNTNLLVSSASKLAPASQGIINFTMNVRADSLNGSTLRNSAFGNAIAIINNSNTVVSDTSNSGTNPDINQNSICNEFVDNAPTILVLPASATPTLFIPEGFSPNGDGINDLFVINGLSNTTENSITIFNRWGNRVYYHGNYNNTWDGYPNIAGTFGKDKLPQGTYYYIIEFKGSGQKPITGFIVLEY